MKRLTAQLTAILMFAIPACVMAATHEVHISNFAFAPQELTVQLGDTVLWHNMDQAPHTATATGGTFDTGTLATNEAYTYITDTTGTFAYVCMFHSEMTGVLYVTSGGGQLHEVSINNFAFNPQTLDIMPGDRVRWTNNDSYPHTVTATNGLFDSGMLNNGDVFEYQFADAGTYAYVCSYHSEMTGVINAGTSGGGDTSWVELTSPTAMPLKDVRFWDDNLGWIAGDQGVLLTTNGGDDWTLVPTSDDVEAVYFISESEGWACGNDGLMLHSTNGGMSWSPQSSGVGEKLRDVWFADAMNGWAGGRDGILIHTTNGGQNWNPQASPANDDIRGIQFLDSDFGWIVASDGLILYTTNGGANWEVQLSVPGGEEDEFEAICMLSDGQHGWVAGGQGRIFHTHDGGQNWEQQESGTTVALMDIFFTDHDNGWACGAGGFLSHAADEGTMWNTQLPPAFSTFNSVYFPSESVGYLVTEDGRIFKRVIQTNAADPREVPVANSAALLTNYPNPFNPTTTIEFTVTNAGPVKLQVFDILGRDLATLVDRSLTVGTYQTHFSGASLASGRYFYRLHTGSDVQTRIMTLVK